MKQAVFMRILYLCTHNRCRSILAEAVTSALGRGRLRGLSAGSAPAGSVHPDTLEQLARRGYATGGLRSKSWGEYAQARPDAVITLCDAAAGEVCPLWLRDAPRVHWGLPDPTTSAPGPAREGAFAAVIAALEARVDRILDLELYRLRGVPLAAALQALAGEY